MNYKRNWMIFAGIIGFMVIVGQANNNAQSQPTKTDMQIVDLDQEAKDQHKQEITRQRAEEQESGRESAYETSVYAAEDALMKATHHRKISINNVFTPKAKDRLLACIEYTDLNGKVNVAAWTFDVNEHEYFALGKGKLWKSLCAGSVSYDYTDEAKAYLSQKL